MGCTSEVSNLNSKQQVKVKVKLFISSPTKPRKRIVDPTLCVKKYRRSAAGGGTSATSDNGPNKETRSIIQLDETVEHILKGIFCHQKSHHEHMHMTARTLSNTAAFVDDRLRAVQVDYVVGYSVSVSVSSSDSDSDSDLNNDHLDIAQRLQARMIRYNILIGYLMSDHNLSPSKFEHKFNAHALHSSFSIFSQLFESYRLNQAYWINQSDNIDEQIKLLDEIMCYSSLMDICSMFLSEETMFDAVSLCRRRPLFQDGNSFRILSHGDLYIHFKSLKGDKDIFPKWKWALEIAAAAEIGNYFRCLNLLADNNDTNDDDLRWKCLARCLISPALPLMRLGSLRQYNKSFGKAEKVSGSDVSNFCSHD